MMKFLFVGLDGLGAEVFERVFLPELPQPLHWGTSYAPVAATGPSWTSIFTGLPVEEHGITDNLGVPQDGSRGFSGLTGLYMFDRHPGSVGVLNLPTGYPPRGKRGDWMVSGYPFDPFSYPAGLLNGIDYVSDFAHIVMRQRAARGASAFWPDEYGDEEALALARWASRIRYMALKRLPAVDYLYVFNVYYDRAGHQVMHRQPDCQVQILGRAAHDVRDWLLRILQEYPAAVVAIASDHGWDVNRATHHADGFWAIYGSGISRTRRMDLENCQVRARVEAVLSTVDDAVQERLRVLGYVE